MSLAGRSLVTIDDLSTDEIEGVFTLAETFENDVFRQTDVCRGKIMASLFFEPSTRTRLSFEAAMHRLGGNVIGVSDVKSTSLAKGESLSDMARIIGSYADIIVIRHPWEGAAKVVADYAGVPVINAGDGGHQHPTQTLLDLYTIKKERHTLKGLKIALWGDLKYGRTTHSLLFALAKFGANILFCPSPGLEVPPNVIRKLITEYGGDVELQHEKKNQDISFPLDAVYMTPSSPHQLAMMPDVNIEVELRKGVDALYVTRTQKERFSESEKERNTGHFPVIDQQFMKGKEFSKTMVMHPLPRVDELAYDMDTDPRSMYFKQAAHGVPIRMALLAQLLGCKESTPSDVASSQKKVNYPLYNRGYGVTCTNPKCVSVQETETKYLTPEFLITSRDPITLRCVYCEHGFEPGFVASADWHEGELNTKKYHSARSRFAKTIKTENLVLFDTERQAQAMGFQPGRSVSDR
ncbi:MAG: aspartate carbamoyltransferase [Dehalococcoidales bacterium]|nr:aspartate carbamoyltransferase [Dehalococcoidales bacterium]